jgi:hypothetical protein
VDLGFSLLRRRQAACRRATLRPQSKLKLVLSAPVANGSDSHLCPNPGCFHLGKFIDLFKHSLGRSFYLWTFQRKNRIFYAMSKGMSTETQKSEVFQGTLDLMALKLEGQE